MVSFDGRTRLPVGASMEDVALRVKLVDFGLAKMLGVQHSVAASLSGTPHYMAPEVSSSNDSTGYSLAVRARACLGLRLRARVVGRDMGVTLAVRRPLSVRPGGLLERGGRHVSCAGGQISVHGVSMLLLFALNRVAGQLYVLRRGAPSPDCVAVVCPPYLPCPSVLSALCCKQERLAGGR